MPWVLSKDLDAKFALDERNGIGEHPQPVVIDEVQHVPGPFPELWRVPDLPRRDFERFIRVLAARSANMLNKSDVARDVGISVKAVGDWLSVLQASGRIILLEPWFTSFGKRIVKTAKVYFRDTGLLCFLLNLDEATPGVSPDVGAVRETLVFSELRARVQQGQCQVNFWHDCDQRAQEIDFALEAGADCPSWLIGAPSPTHPIAEHVSAGGLNDLWSTLT